VDAGIEAGTPKSGNQRAERAMVDSLHWDAPPRDLPMDEGSVSRAVRKALAAKSQENRGYACFPLPGESASAVVNAPPQWGGTSSAFELPVKCDTRLEETEARLWKLTLLMSWNDLGAAGSETIELWIDVDGNIVSTSAQNEGSLPPAGQAAPG
jgi:hypothetical protein